jgi:hypothetical protein
MEQKMVEGIEKGEIHTECSDEKGSCTGSAGHGL